MRTLFVARALKLLGARRSLTGLLGSLLATGSQLCMLGFRVGERLLEPSDFLARRALLTLKARNLTRSVALLCTRHVERRLRLAHALSSLVKDGGKIGLKVLELTNAPLALKSAGLVVRSAAKTNDAAVAHAGPIGRHIEHTRYRGRCEGLFKRIDEIHVAEQSRNGSSVAIDHGELLDQALSRSPSRGLGYIDIARDQSGLPRRGCPSLYRSANLAQALGRIHDECFQVAGEQLLYQGLQRPWGLDKIAQARRNRSSMFMRDAGGQRRRIRKAFIELLEARELGANLIQAVARIGFSFTELRQGVLRGYDGVLGLFQCCRRISKLSIDFLGTDTAGLERGANVIGLIVDLLKARGEHRVLELGVRERFPNLCKLERSLIGLALGFALLARECADAAVELLAARARFLRRRLKAGDVVFSHRERGAHFFELLARLGKLGRQAPALVLRPGKRAPHLGEARHHVVALFLKQAHIRVEPADHILHAAALLPKVAHEEPFFLEHDLKLFELAFLFAQAILRELERGRGLLGAMLALPPGFLQATELVHGQYPRELVRSLGKVAMFAGAIHLALKRAQLARDLAADVAGTGEVLIHALDLARGALLAALVLGDACGLLDERAALLRAALKDGIELALADDGMGILAQARIVQDVLDIHKAARALVDEVLALARAVHAPRDGNLVEIDGKHVVGIVEHKRDLSHAHGLARR